jgi:prevent-host-death family protein
MQVVAIRELKDHLSEYVRLVRTGERLLITSHGEVDAELRSPEPDRTEDAPLGLRELVRRGTTARSGAHFRPKPAEYLRSVLKYFGG